MDCMERRSHAWGVYRSQYTSSMGTARVKLEEETDIRVVRNLEESNVGTKEKVSNKA